ncbi:MAG: hypothetical protein R3E97_13465 [Candidatus Eisenbacteria bacterium]
MRRSTSLFARFALLCTGFVASTTAFAGDSKLETALGDLYGICLFEPVASNPFAGAALLSRSDLAPGVTGFIESNLASIPMTPPSVKSVFEDGRIVNVVTGFSPIFTENTATVGGGKLFFGGNYSYYDFSKLRGQSLADMSFVFAQDDGGDVVAVNMPLEVKAKIFTFYSTFGVTNQFDVGLAFPIVDMTVRADGTTFNVLGNDSGCRYGPLDCNPANPQGSRITPELTLDAVSGAVEEADLNPTFLSTVAVRLKYRFPYIPNSGRVALVADLRMPVRSEDSLLGAGEFGGFLTLVGEAQTRNGFTPYFNLGTHLWSGDSASSLSATAGFTQLFARNLSFSFDLIGDFDLESDPFLETIDNQVPVGASTSSELAVAASSIPSANRDHRLDAALGFQYALTQDFQVYGSGLFSLLDQGLTASIIPMVGFAVHY